MKLAVVCGASIDLGSSLKQNIKKVLNKYGKQAELDHVPLKDTGQIQADYIVTKEEFLSQIQNSTPKICINNFEDIDEIESALKSYGVI